MCSPAGTADRSGAFQLLTILRAALAEGPALFATMIVMLTGDKLGFLGAAFGLLLFALILPTRGKYENFEQEVTGRPPQL